MRKTNIMIEYAWENDLKHARTCVYNVNCIIVWSVWTKSDLDVYFKYYSV